MRPATDYLRLRNVGWRRGPGRGPRRPPRRGRADRAEPPPRRLPPLQGRRRRLRRLPGGLRLRHQVGDSTVDEPPLAWNENQMRQLGRLGSTTKAKAVTERVVKVKR